MKTITLLNFALFISVLSAHAQIPKGTVLLGGSLGISDNNFADGSSKNENNSFFVQPSFGFTVKENKVVGFNLSYGQYKSKNGSVSQAESRSYGAGIFLRRYHPLGKGFYLFGQGNAGYNYSKQEQSYTSAPNPTSTQINKQNSITLSVYPGLSYAVSKRFHFEMTLNNMLGVSYAANKQISRSANIESTTKSKEVSFYANVNPVSNLALGFRVLLGKDKKQG